MTNEREPLWSDENIANDAKRASSNPTIQATIRSCLLFMRHGYEARIAELEAEARHWRQQHAECTTSLITEVRKTERLEVRIAELEAQLAAESEKAAHYYQETAAIVADACAETERLKSQLAQTWQPVTIDGTVDYNGTWPTIPAEYAGDEIALCRLVESQPLDMPDGPGWWGGVQDRRHFVVNFSKFEAGEVNVLLQWGDDDYTMRCPLAQFRKTYRDTRWYRLTMPWEESQPTIPPDVRETLREALGNALTDLTQDYDSYTPAQKAAKRDRIDAALAWLDAQGGGRNG